MVVNLTHKIFTVDVNENFIQHWGTLFEEFREEKPAKLYYCMYFLRRVIIGLVVLIIPGDIFQLSLSLAITLVVIII